MAYNALDPATAVPINLVMGAPRTGFGKSLLDIKDEVALALGGRFDVDDDRMAAWVNDAYLDMASSLELSSMKGTAVFDTVAENGQYLLPENITATERVALFDLTTYGGTEGLVLRKIDAESFRRAPALVADNPQSYFFQDDLLVLYPSPAAVVSIRVDCIFEPQPLVEDTDCPIFKRAWHEGLVLLTRTKAHQRLMEYDLAAAAENDYTNWVRRKIDPAAQEDTNRYPGMVPVRRARQMPRDVRPIPGMRLTDNGL